MTLWKEGKFKALRDEGKVIQKRLIASRPRQDDEKYVAKKFADMMSQGRLREASRLLSEDNNGGILQMNCQMDESHTVRDILQEKHPDSQPLLSSTI